MEETIRITQSEYDREVELNRMINQYTEEGLSTTERFQFLNRGMYPTVKIMEREKVRMHVREYWRLLLYYHIDGLYECDDPQYRATKEYIKAIFDELVMIIPDEVMEPISKIQKAQWRKMSINKQVDIFRPLVEYYGPNEQETMIRDIGYQKFMLAYDVTEQIYLENKSEKLSELEKDLCIIWDTIWSDPAFLKFG